MVDEHGADQTHTPTSWDHDQMQFWVWACDTSAQRYLDAYRKFEGASLNPKTTPAERTRLRLEMDLAKYNFLMTVGSVIRNLKRSRILFPQIEQVCKQATNLFGADAKDVRDMIEHADDYFAGKGKKQSKFETGHAGLDAIFPGDQPGTVDATAVISLGDGICIGGRLNVQKVAAEVQAIRAVVSTIAAPAA